eukprot:7070589-Prymnesium_polylepis.1
MSRGRNTEYGNTDGVETREIRESASGATPNPGTRQMHAIRALPDPGARQMHTIRAPPNPGERQTRRGCGQKSRPGSRVAGRAQACQRVAWRSAIDAADEAALGRIRAHRLDE